MTSAEYARYARGRADRQADRLRSMMMPVAGARIRSQLLCGSALVGRDTAIRRKRQRDEQISAWIEHVKDGRPLTEHGARLLGVAWPETS